MLHLIFQSPISIALLQRIESHDDVIFLENAVFQLNKHGILTSELAKMLNNRIRFYVLELELETRGIKIDELVLGVEVINYPSFVELTETNKLIKSWN